jgi:small-conductance mechanosensitive channel
MDVNTIKTDFLEIYHQFKVALFEFLPNLIGALAIFLIGLLIARLIRALVPRLIKKLPAIIPNQRIRNRVLNYIDEKPISKVLAGILYWILIFFFLTIATETLGLPVVTTWLSGIVGYLPKILSAFLIGAIGVMGGMILRDLTATTASSAGIEYGNILGKLVQISVILVTILIGMDQIGIDITLLVNVVVITLAALLLGGALAFGLGAKTSVSNILASYYLQKVYRVGDEIQIGDKKGRIIEISPLAVILDSAEGQTCIPSKEFNSTSSILLKREKKNG